MIPQKDHAIVNPLPYSLVNLIVCWGLIGLFTLNVISPVGGRCLTEPIDSALILPQTISAKENYRSELLKRGVPTEYLNQIKAILRVDNNNAPKSKELNWLDYKAHEISEDPAGLNNTTTLITRIQHLGNIVAKFEGSNLLDVPFGIKGQYGDLSYLIGFDNIQLHPDYASVDAVASIYLPFLNDTLYFIAAGLKYSNRSGFIGQARLQLVQDFVIEINPEKSALIFRGYRSKSTLGSYIDIDCDGISSVTFGIDFTFNPEFIKPVNSTQKFVRAFGKIQYDRGKGFVTDHLSISPFYFRDFKEVAFSLQDLSIDLDEKKTTIPYIHEYLDLIETNGTSAGISAAEWTGFYCERFQLIIGNKYIASADGQPVYVEGNHIVIDDLGFTARLSVDKTLLGLDRGTIDGWAFSIDKIELGILANRFSRFGFGGLLHVPLLAEQRKGAKEIGDQDKEVTSGATTEGSCLVYEANYDLDSANLSFRVAKMDSQQFSVPALFADLIIRPGSYLQFVTGENYRLEAYLNATLSFEGKLSSTSTLKIPEILFQGLFISNRSPYLAVDLIHPLMVDSSQLGKFAFTFGEMSLRDENPELTGGQFKTLSLEDLSLSLGAIDDGDALRITSSLDIYFGVKPDGARQKWVGRGIQLNKFGFEGTLPGIDYVKGEMAFFRNDPLYGIGFGGGGIVRFGFLNAGVRMMCMFGNSGSTGYDFSYVDAALDFGNPVGDPAFTVHMLMAGYHKNMSRRETSEFVVGEIAGEYEVTSRVRGGQFSDNKFVPSQGSWGIRGGLIAKVGDGAVVGVQILFDKNKSQEFGTSSRFFLEGLVEIMPKDSDPQKSRANSAVTDINAAGADIQSVTPREFQGAGAFGGYIRLEVTKDFSGTTLNAGMGIHGQVGPIQISFYGEYFKSPENWHLFIGEPGNRLKLSYGEEISDVVSASISVHGYFMIGNSPAMPKVLPPPYAVDPANADNLRIAYDSLTKNPATNIFSTSVADLSRGKAFAFGAGISLEAAINIPGEESPWLFVSAGADLGLDVLLQPARPACNLQNVTEVGLNNWYLYGQMYAGIAASVGIIIKKRVLKIFEGGAAVIVTGGGFGPTYGAGTWRFYYQFLWKKGSAQGVFKFGQPCNNLTATFDPGNILEAINPTRLISESTSESITPVIGINSDFKIDFALPADRKTRQSLLDFNKGVSEEFQVHLQTDILLTDSSGLPIPGNRLFDNDGLSLIFRPLEMLNPGEIIRLHLNAIVFDDTGIYSLEDRTYQVDTTIFYQVDPDGILGLTSEDLAVSYPIHDQRYFHKDEFDFIMFSFGKDLPIQTSKLNSFLLLEQNGSYEEIEKSDLKGDNRGFVQPVFKSLENDHQYQWVVRVETGADQEQDIAVIKFRTSHFSSFAEKSATVKFAEFSLNNQRDSILPLNLSAGEPLEFYSGNVITTYLAGQSKPAPNSTNDVLKPTKFENSELIKPGENYLTRFQATFRNDPKYPYFKEIYDGYIPYGSTIEINCVVDDADQQNRQKAKLSDAIQYHQMYPWSNKVLTTLDNTVQYNLLHYLKKDHKAFKEAKPQVPEYYADCQDYSQGPLPYYLPGSYLLLMRYFIPGFEEYSVTTTELHVEFKN